MPPRRGFTLIELLIVVGFLVAMMGILLPSLQRARRATQNAVCLNNLDRIQVGFVSYADDNGGFTPSDGQAPYWDDLLIEQGVSPTRFICPAQPARQAELSMISYAWRDMLHVDYPDARLTGVPLLTVQPRDLFLVFDLQADWHERNFRNVVDVDGRTQAADATDFMMNMSMVADPWD